MIVDRLENADCYSLGPLWEQTVEFLKNLTPDTPCGKVELAGDNLFVIIDSYETKAREDAKLETHRVYTDVQFIISGTEIHEVFSPDYLTTNEPYSDKRDAQFYNVPQTAPVRVSLEPGDFTVYFPQDAHMPGLASGAPQTIKKAVVKIRTTLLG